MQTELTRAEIIEFLTERDGFVCTFPGCTEPMTATGNHMVTIDHIYPQARARAEGWTEEQINDLSNLALQGKRCNARKGHLVYDEDGNLPLKRREPRAVAKSHRPEICDTCYSGRILLPGEECPDCGLGPQPASMPKALQRKPKECDHAKYICWACGPLGIVERKEAFRVILEGPE